MIFCPISVPSSRPALSAAGLLFIAIFGIDCPTPTLAQCGGWVASSMSTPGLDRRITVLHQWDADGPGGNPPVLVAAGDMTASGSTPLSYITQWNGEAWVGIGAGLGGATNALTTLSTGELVAGGFFSVSVGAPANRVARFNGTAWSGFGNGANSAVYALAPSPGGGMFMGGWFTQAASTIVGRIARWNPASSTFSVPGPTPGLNGANDWVWALATMPNGDIIAAGAFTLINGSSFPRIARLSGNTWLPLGTGITGNEVYELFVMPSGDLIASGNFTAAGGVPARNVARWNGVSWSAMGAGFPSPARDFAVLSTGELVAANVTSEDRLTVGISKWTGTDWVRLGSANGTIFALSTLPNGDLAVGGQFTQVDGLAVNNFAIYRPGTPQTCGGCSLADVAGGGSGGLSFDGIVDGSDFIAFINSFSVGDVAIDPLADVAGGGADGLSPDGIVDGSDFIAFINAFGAGC